MDLSFGTILILVPACFIIALAYAMVGLGGGTGYIAIMTLVGVPGERLASTALVLNIVVTGAALLRYGLAGRIRSRVFLPFLALGLPMAFFGGSLRVPSHVFDAILCFALIVVALAMLKSARAPEEVLSPSLGKIWLYGLLSGSAIGFASGFLGIGGGVFLGPLVLFLKWAGAKEVAAMNSLFILLVSLVGLLAHGIKGSISLYLVAPLALAVLAGGLLGAHLGETRLQPATLKKVFAVIIFVAAVKAGFSAAGFA